jgi:hypothetical protein
LRMSSVVTELSRSSRPDSEPFLTFAAVIAL